MLMKQNSPFEITSYEQLERFAKTISDSDFAPRDFKGKPGNVIVAVHFGHELGLQPMQALQNISVVNGRPQIWGDAALALVRNNPECKHVKEWMTGSIKGGDAVAYCEVMRKDEIIKREFSVAQAVQANLIGKAGTWTQYPERMLQMRARGFALRDAFPDVLKGVYIEGELIPEADYEIIEPKEKPKSRVQEVKELLEQQVNLETGEVIESIQESISKNDDSFIQAKMIIDKSETPSELIEAADFIRTLSIQESQKQELRDLYNKKSLTVKSK